LWAKHENYFKESCFHLETSNSNPETNKTHAIIKFAVDKSLSGLSAMCESHSSEILGISKGKLASIVNESLMKRVVVNRQMVSGLLDIELLFPCPNSD
jgi:hypothetical protein